MFWPMEGLFIISECLGSSPSARPHFSFEICSLHKLGICDITNNELLWLQVSGIKNPPLLEHNLFYRIGICSEETQLTKKEIF